MTIVEDSEWVTRLQSDGDARDNAIQELNRILSRGLTAICRSRYSGKLSAEDVVQVAMIKILDKLHTFEGRSKFTTWAMTIATRVAISEMRRKHFQDVNISALAKEDSLRVDFAAADLAPAGNEMEKDSILKKLDELIGSRLTSKQQHAVRSLLSGMPVEVFAEKTGSNRNAVYKLIHDARVKLRDGFESAGIKADDINSVFA